MSSGEATRILLIELRRRLAPIHAAFEAGELGLSLVQSGDSGRRYTTPSTE